MTEESASLKPADMTPEETPKPKPAAKPKRAKKAKTTKTTKTAAKAKDTKLTPAYKTVMVDVRPHLDVLCDALRAHRTVNNRIFSKVKRAVMDAMSTVSQERREGLARQRATVLAAGEKTKEKKRQDKIAKAQKRLDDLKRQAKPTKAGEKKPQ